MILLSRLSIQYLNIFIFNSIDEQDVIEISDNETEGEDGDELALAPHSYKAGPPSTPSPVKSSFVIFLIFIVMLYLCFILFYFCHFFVRGRRHVIPTLNRDDEMTIIPRYAVEHSSLLR